MSERRKAIDECRTAVEVEPECPGPMPDPMWEALCTAYAAGDRGEIEESYRALVQLTKRNILERMGKL